MIFDHGSYTEKINDKGIKDKNQEFKPDPLPACKYSILRRFSKYANYLNVLTSAGSFQYD
jgi:hypothetical protein